MRHKTKILQKMENSSTKTETKNVQGKVITRYVKADGKSANVKLVFQSKMIEKFGKLAKQIEREMLAELDEKEGAKVSEERESMVQAFVKKYYAGAGVTEEKEELSAEELALLQKFGVKI